MEMSFYRNVCVLDRIRDVDMDTVDGPSDTDSQNYISLCITNTANGTDDDYG